MFNVGSQEILIVLILVFLLFGPRHIPEVAQTLGRGIGELKRTLGGVEEGIRRTATEFPDLSNPDAKPPMGPPTSETVKPRRDLEKPPVSSSESEDKRLPPSDGSGQAGAIHGPGASDSKPSKEIDGS